MNNSSIVAITAALTTGLPAFAAIICLQTLAARFRRKAEQHAKLLAHVGTQDFTVRGATSSGVAGLFLLLPYLAVCVWVYWESRDLIITLLPILMFLWFGILGTINILSPFRRRIEFTADHMEYRDVIGGAFSTSRDDILSTEIAGSSIIVNTRDGKHAISSEFQDPYKIYAKLKNWSP